MWYMDERAMIAIARSAVDQKTCQFASQLLVLSLTMNQMVMLANVR